MTLANDAYGHVQNELEIDPNCLDEEWLTQAPLYWRYAKALAGEKESLDRAKRRLSVLIAETERKIRKDPESFGISKVTEGAIKAAITVDKEVGNLEDSIIEINHDVNVLGAAVASLDHRKRALTDLVQLHMCSYYAEPKAPDLRTAQSIEKAKQKEVDEKIRKRKEVRNKE